MISNNALKHDINCLSH